MIRGRKLGALALRLDEGPQTVEVDGSEPESEATRPLRTAGLRFERYTSAMKHLSPPALFSGGPGYRLRGRLPFRELLGEPEHDGTRNQSIDYERWPLFQRLQQARADGSVGVFFLGLGQNALILTAAVLTVMVIDDDEAVVRWMLETEPMTASGAACLALAWQHRNYLGL